MIASGKFYFQSSIHNQYIYLKKLHNHILHKGYLSDRWIFPVHLGMAVIFTDIISDIYCKNHQPVGEYLNHPSEYSVHLSPNFILYLGESTYIKAF